MKLNSDEQGDFYPSFKHIFMLISLISNCHLLACNSAPPNFVEISAPLGSIDALGPYAFSAKVNGAVDQVSVLWLASTPQNEIPSPSLSDFNSAERLDLSFNAVDGLWRGELAGEARVATYYYYFQAKGPGGVSREPRGGIERFQVNALNASCRVDRDCQEGELCHRRDLLCFIPPQPCSDHAHCPRDQECNEVSGLCRFIDGQCTDDSECDENQECNAGRCIDSLPPPPLLECEPACEDGFRCLEGVCIAERSDCTADGQCGLGASCDLRSGTCQLGERGVFCSPCESNPSTSEEACGIGFECRPNLAGCRPVCGSRGPDYSECDAEERCVDGICLPPDRPEGNLCYGLTCSSDEECGNTRCDRGRCAIIQSCTRDEDCSEEWCEDGVCQTLSVCDRLTCDDDSVCLGGRCQALANQSNTCERCTNDLDCGALSHCISNGDLNSGRCHSLCERAEHCAEGERCYLQETQYGYCAPAEGFACSEPTNQCEIDFLEPNDRFNEAISINIPMEASNETVSFEAILCSLDDDYYQLFPSAAGLYEVNLLSEQPSEYYIYSETGEELAYFPNFFPVAEGITFELSDFKVLRVKGVNESSSQYQVNLTPRPVVMIECTNDDNLEDNDTLEQSYPVGAGAELTLALCPNDADWFTFRGRAGELWNVSLFLRDFVGEAKLSVGTRQAYNEGTELTWFYTEGGPMTAEFTLQASEPHYLNLICEDCTESVRYLLSLSR